jgi:uroporphyrinogen-III decarboxylase
LQEDLWILNSFFWKLHDYLGSFWNTDKNTTWRMHLWLYSQNMRNALGSFQMNSRQRVQNAINFKSTDRPPIDLGSMRASGINASLYDRLKRRIGLTSPTKIHDPIQILAEVELDLLEKIGGDIVGLEPSSAASSAMPHNLGGEQCLFDGTRVSFPPGTKISHDPDGSWILHDPSGERLARMPKNGYYFDFLRSTMGGRINPDAFQPTSDVADETLDALNQRARFLYEETDKAILGWSGDISFFGLSAILSDNITQGSLDQWLLMLMTEKETATQMMGRMTDAALAKLKLYYEAVGDRCVAWGISSDDAGTQNSGLIPTDLFREMIKPHYKRVCDWVHQNTTWKTFLHSCGSVNQYIPDWIDAGIDILNPIQISAADMEPERLKREYGGKIVFWGGGCETQHVLPLCTPEEVRTHVKSNLDVFSPGGGFVFTQVHNIQQNVPVENVEAMFETARHYKSPVS